MLNILNISSADITDITAPLRAYNESAPNNQVKTDKISRWLMSNWPTIALDGVSPTLPEIQTFLTKFIADDNNDSLLNISGGIQGKSIIYEALRYNTYTESFLYHGPTYSSTEWSVATIFAFNNTVQYYGNTLTFEQFWHNYSTWSFYNNHIWDILFYLAIRAEQTSLNSKDHIMSKDGKEVANSPKQKFYEELSTVLNLDEQKKVSSTETSEVTQLTQKEKNISIMRKGLEKTLELYSTISGIASGNTEVLLFNDEKILLMLHFDALTHLVSIMQNTSVLYEPIPPSLDLEIAINLSESERDNLSEYSSQFNDPVIASHLLSSSRRVLIAAKAVNQLKLKKDRILPEDFTGKLEDLSKIHFTEETCYKILAITKVMQGVDSEISRAFYDITRAIQRQHMYISNSMYEDAFVDTDAG